MINFEITPDIDRTGFKTWLSQHGYIKSEKGHQNIDYRAIEDKFGLKRREVQNYLSGNSRDYVSPEVRIKVENLLKENDL